MTGLENPTHILFVLVIAVLLFGPKRLPELGRSLGSGIREFRSSLAGEEQDNSDSQPLPTKPVGKPRPPA
ncbi:MAG: twin-arginine translocase TatA/TatE family subunit [Solirubrobacterales bacterium]